MKIYWFEREEKKDEDKQRKEGKDDGNKNKC